MTDYIVIEDYPLPPQSNNMYYTDRARGTRHKSMEYRRFIHEVNLWSARHYSQLLKTRRLVKEWTRNPLSMIRVHTYFGFLEKKLVTKITKTRPKQRLKKLDTSNRIKPCHDTLAHVIDVDDARYSIGEVDKVLSDTESVLIVLEPAKLRTMDAVMGIWTED